MCSAPKFSGVFMYPYLNIFGSQISMYSLAAVTGLLLSGFVACILSKRRSILYVDTIMFLLFSFIGVYFGGIILYAITQWQYISALFRNFSAIWNDGMFIPFLTVIFGGSVFYGGLLGGIGAGILYLNVTKKSLGDYSDLAAMVAPLFHAFGRIGCFLGGCCYGIECDVGFVYENSLVESANGVRRFPIQLVESGFEFILFALILFMFLKRIQQRRLFLWYLFIYSIGRFIFEFFRGDEYRGFVGIFSTSQFISIFIFAVSLFLLVRTNIRLKKEKS